MLIDSKIEPFKFLVNDVGLLLRFVYYKINDKRVESGE